MDLGVRQGSYLMACHCVSESCHARIRRNAILGVTRSAFVLVLLVGCGPELTEPASTNVTGRWTSGATIGPLSDVTMDLQQRSEGEVEGHWMAVSSDPNPRCTPDLALSTTGPLTGSNKVVGLQLAFLGAGDFNGQVRDKTTLS